MWRMIGAALIAVAVLATPVLAVETVPAKIHSAGKAKMKANPAGKIVTGKISKPKVANSNIAKVNRASGAIAKGHIAKGSNSKTQPARLAAVAGSKSGNKKTKVGTKGRHMVAVKPPRQHVSVLPGKKRQQVKAAEPVETTGSVAPRSVSTPRLY